jgi:hypothetical protein
MPYNRRKEQKKNETAAKLEALMSHEDAPKRGALRNHPQSGSLIRLGYCGYGT